MRPLRIGVVGLGVISKFYLAAISRLPQVTLAAVCDLRADALATLLGRVPCYSSHQVMLGNEGLDAVVVTTPNDTHAAVCRDVLNAGLPVCVEKPLAVSLDEGRVLDRLASTLGVPLYTAFHRRHNRNALALLETSHEAPIVSITARYFERIEEHIGADTWYLDAGRCGGGCVADNGPNAFDLVRLFLGDVRVTEADVTRDGQGIDRQAVIELESEEGATASVELDWSYPGERKDLELRFADGGVARADLLHGHPGFKNSLWHEYLGITADFAETVLRRGTAEPVHGGLAALELVDATYRIEHAGTRSSTGGK
ncbi:Gfo/Idh/MocA family protein [Amycolatopsis nigrescens]|uniref:Gfo/Idh/MocA family protein n=1 Tax=Amycolatopsis nigrescens TaxID=381445 RepID=UPI00037AF2FF|nr:Gfo/Idh/MocA family oxidoreductase [Amycolatopsis nigrescens]